MKKVLFAVAACLTSIFVCPTHDFKLNDAGPVSCFVVPPAWGATETNVPQVARKSNVIKFRRGMKVSEITKRPDTDLVQFSKGSLKVGSLRRLQEAQKQFAVRGRKAPPEVRMKPLASNVRMAVDKPQDIQNALKLPDSATVRMGSSDKLATVGQLKYAVIPLVEKRLGRKLNVSAPSTNLSGPAIKVSSTTTQAEWKEILQKPDNTVLEATPGGKRVTVGALKQHLKKSPAMPGLKPMKVDGNAMKGVRRQ